MTVGPRSLAFRVIAFSTGWAILALIVISTVITTLYRQASERGFDSLLSAHLFNLIGSVGVSDQRRPDRQPQSRRSALLAAEFGLVLGGRAGFGGRDRRTSLVLDDRSHSVAAGRRRRRSMRNSSAAISTDGIAGEDLAVFESEFVLDAQNRDRAVPGDGQPDRTGTGDIELRAPAFHLSVAVRRRHDRHQRDRHPARAAAARAACAMRWRWCAKARRSGSTATFRPRSSRLPTKPTP